MIILRDKHLLIRQIRKTFEYQTPVANKRDLYKVPQIPIQESQTSIPVLKPEDSYSDMEDSIQEVESNPSVNSQTEVEAPKPQVVQEALDFGKIWIQPDKKSKLTEILNQNTQANPMATQYAQFVPCTYPGGKERSKCDQDFHDTAIRSRNTLVDSGQRRRNCG
jgi:hypothetical protein